MKKVLVTGGTGFVGTRLQKKRPDWIYISSQDYDLTKSDSCRQMLLDIKPDSIVHLAGKVGGIKENSNKQGDFFYLNTMINTNIVHESYRTGVERLLSSLSTCAFPDILKNYPFVEEDILKGAPASSNLSYGYTKRSLYIQSLSYKKQYGVNYNCFCPSNIYGPNDNFDPDSSHFVPSLIQKVFNASESEEIELWGTGKPLRQQLYVDDLVDIIPVLLEKHNTSSPLIVCGDENMSISEMANVLLKKVNKNVKIRYNQKLDGQFRKDGSNKKLLKLISDYKFTSFEEGVLKTYEWYGNSR